MGNNVLWLKQFSCIWLLYQIIPPKIEGWCGPENLGRAISIYSSNIDSCQYSKKPISQLSSIFFCSSSCRLCTFSNDNTRVFTCHFHHMWWSISIQRWGVVWIWSIAQWWIIIKKHYDVKWKASEMIAIIHIWNHMLKRRKVKYISCYKSFFPIWLPQICCAMFTNFRRRYCFHP